MVVRLYKSNCVKVAVAVKSMKNDEQRSLVIAMVIAVIMIVVVIVVVVS